MKQLKRYKICPVCGTKNEANAIHCIKCFYDLSTVSVIEEGKSLKLVGNKFAIFITKDTILGREASGKEYLNDKAISRKHLKIFWKNDVPYIEDLNSTNGTYLNNEKMIPMKEYLLSNSDKINIANKIEFIVKLQNLEEGTVKEIVLEDKTYKENIEKKDERTVIYSGPKIEQFLLDREREINGYKIKNHLAAGGESDTYLVEKDNKEYVLKIYRSDIIPNLEIIENLKKITHDYPNYFVKLEEFWKSDDKYYEVYEFCRYGNLANFLKSNKNVFNFKKKKDLFDLVSKINDALKILHKNGILHRDLKLSNILVKESFNLVLSDFGISKDIKSSVVYTKNFKGSYRYSAPETLSNKFNKKSDYWSLGIIVYELYFKKNPFEKKNINSVFSELLDNKPFHIPSNEVDSEILILLSGLLEKEPLKRWGSKEIDNFLKNIQLKTKNQNENNLIKQENAKSWEDYGFSLLEQKEWSQKGYSSEEAYKWKKAGFNLSDSIFLRNINIEPEEAEYAKKEGLSINEMKILKTRLRCLVQNTKAHRGSVNSVDYNLQDSMLASGGKDYTLKLWNETVSENFATLERHTDYIECIAFSSDGKIVASASRDKTIKLWDPYKKECIANLEGHDRCVGCIAFSPNSKLLASGGWDTKVIIWDVENKKIIDIYNENLSYIHSISFSQNGKYIASGSEDGTVYVWDIEKKRVIFKNESNSPVTSFVAFHPRKENVLAFTSSNGNIFIYNIEDRQQVAKFKSDIKKISLAFNSSGDILAAGEEDGSIIFWEFESGNTHTVLRKNLEDLYVEKGSTVVIKNGNQIEIWDKYQKKRISVIKFTSFAINSISFNKNNRFLACGTNDGYIQIWESYLPTTIRTIFQNGFTIREYLIWLEKGYDIDEAKIWKENSFEIDEADKWKKNGFLPNKAKEWKLNGFSIEEAKEWKILNFFPYEAAKWTKEGFTTDQLNMWIDEGFSLEEAREWILNGFDIDEAKKWSKDYIPPQKAKKYRKFGIIGHFLAKFF